MQYDDERFNEFLTMLYSGHEEDRKPSDYIFSFSRQPQKAEGVVKAPHRTPETHPYAYGRKRVDVAPAQDWYKPVTGQENDLRELQADGEDNTSDYRHPDPTSHSIEGDDYREEPAIARLRIARERREALANESHEAYVERVHRISRSQQQAARKGGATNGK